MSVVATFGGIIVVEATHKRLVGLTAAHSLKKLHSPLSDQLLTHDRECSILSTWMERDWTPLHHKTPWKSAPSFAIRSILRWHRTMTGLLLI
ncbi:hypothetical protein LB505_006228 [Fusarium chuoi]|nr:hypothetical protein LB505_006228 [Fusarium chuoi]